MTTPEEPAPVPAGPACAQCGAPAAVQWQRRLTDTELDAALALEQQRRDNAVLLADPAQPPPTFPPMPGPGDYTTVVHGCADHAVSLDAATRIHQATCTAQGGTCGCTPEPLPPPEPSEEPAPAVPLPADWIAGGG